MAHRLCLAHLSVIELTPPQVVDTAADAGFDLVSLRLAAASDSESPYPMIGEAPMLRETIARLRWQGVSVHDIEVVRLRADTDVRAHEPLFTAAAELGATQVLIAGDDDDEAALADRLQAMAELGQAYGLRMALEFMPWRGVRSLAMARRIVEAAGAGGLVVDAIHLDRTGGSAADIAALPRALWGYFQICDAPAARPTSDAELIFQARQARLPPGQGDLDLVAMVRAIPHDGVISVEVPLHGRPGLLPPGPRARMLRRATLDVIGAAL